MERRERGQTEQHTNRRKADVTEYNINSTRHGAHYYCYEETKKKTIINREHKISWGHIIEVRNSGSRGYIAAHFDHDYRTGIYKQLIESSSSVCQLGKEGERVAECFRSLTERVLQSGGAAERSDGSS